MSFRFGGDLGLFSPLPALSFILRGLSKLFLFLDLAEVEPIEEDRS
jgi:hypothetical protein